MSTLQRNAMQLPDRIPRQTIHSNPIARKVRAFALRSAVGRRHIVVASIRRRAHCMSHRART